MEEDNKNQETLYLLVFGDQTFDVGPHLPRLLDARNSNVVLRDFLERAYDAIRAQLFRLPGHAREELPRFTSIEDVLLWKPSDGASRCVPLDMALTCLYQLGSFIIRYSHTEPYLHTTDTIRSDMC